MVGGNLLLSFKAIERVKVKAKTKKIQGQKMEMLRIARNARFWNKKIFPIVITLVDLACGWTATE